MLTTPLSLPQDLLLVSSQGWEGWPEIILMMMMKKYFQDTVPGTQTCDVPQEQVQHRLYQEPGQTPLTLQNQHR